MGGSTLWVGVVIVGVVVTRVGTGAIIEPLRHIEAVIARRREPGIAAVTTACGAWRWVRRWTRGLGMQALISCGRVRALHPSQLRT